MNKICTDIEQSKKLLELGIDINTADMCWSIFKTSWGERIYTIIACPMLPNQGKGTEKLEYLPAWSLTALLDILPKIIKHKTFLVELVPLFIETSALLWHIGYRDIYIAKEDNLLDAAFEMIVWLKENNKI